MKKEIQDIVNRNQEAESQNTALKICLNELFLTIPDEQKKKFLDSLQDLLLQNYKPLAQRALLFQEIQSTRENLLKAFESLYQAQLKVALGSEDRNGDG